MPADLNCWHIETPRVSTTTGLTYLEVIKNLKLNCVVGSVLAAGHPTERAFSCPDTEVKQ